MYKFDLQVVWREKKILYWLVKSKIKNYTHFTFAKLFSVTIKDSRRKNCFKLLKIRDFFFFFKILYTIYGKFTP